MRSSTFTPGRLFQIAGLAGAEVVVEEDHVGHLGVGQGGSAPRPCPCPGRSWRRALRGAASACRRPACRPPRPDLPALPAGPSWIQRDRQAATPTRIADSLTTLSVRSVSFTGGWLSPGLGKGRQGVRRGRFCRAATVIAQPRFGSHAIFLAVVVLPLHLSAAHVTIALVTAFVQRPSVTASFTAQSSSWVCVQSGNRQRLT